MAGKVTNKFTIHLDLELRSREGETGAAPEAVLCAIKQAVGTGSDLNYGDHQVVACLATVETKEAL